MSIGKEWAQELKAEEARKKAASGEGPAKEAAEIIKSIPDRIAAARAKKESSARVFGWVAASDVPGTDKDRVDNLYARLRKENRVLRPEDLAGRARLVLEWCDRNDLETFFVSVDVPMHDNEYEFHIRPKRG